MKKSTAVIMLILWLTGCVSTPNETMTGGTAGMNIQWGIDYNPSK